MKTYILALALIVLSSCNQDVKELTANEIIDKSIEVSGGKLFDKSTIDLDFRNRHYKAVRNSGVFQYEREFTDSLGVIKDVLSNNGFQRYLDNKEIKVSDTMAPRYGRSVNSVHYFSVLPYGLNDVAVNKEPLKNVIINGINYHKIKVTFNQDGGGDDFEDVFIYWIHAETFKVDYLAYSYLENDGEFGLRFREAYNERYINGLRFVDYNNYKPIIKGSNVKDLDKMFEAGKLELLSKIELENVKVK